MKAWSLLLRLRLSWDRMEAGLLRKIFQILKTKTNIVQNPLAYFRSKMVAALVILEQMIAEQTIAAMDQTGGKQEHRLHS